MFNIAYRISKEGIKEDILDEIAEFFDVDACSIVSVKDLDITYIASSSFFRKHDIDLDKLYKSSKDENPLFSKTIKDGLYVTNDYQNDKNASEIWKKTGLKSVCFLKFDVEFNGVIALENFERDREFLSEDVEKLKFLSTFIANTLEGVLFRELIKDKINLLDIDYIDSDSKEDIKKWLKEQLKNILKSAHSKAVSFVFPKYNIYSFLSNSNRDDFVLFKKTKQANEMLTYKMYKQKLMGPCVFVYDFVGDKLPCLSRVKVNLGINNILVVPIYEKGELLSIIGYGYVSEYKFSLYDVMLTTMIAKKLTRYIESTKEFSKLKNIITKSEEDIINSFILTIEMRDVYTKGHSQRVAYYARKIAEMLELNKNLTEQIYIAGLLHDIGKISIPDSVLMKSSKLSNVEYEMIKYHSLLSYEIVSQFRSLDDLKSIAKMVRQHHEKCDGSGYPDGLLCKNISLGARILAIADVFDALTTSRPYRDVFTPEDAIRIMRGETDHFDCRIFEKSVDILLKNYNEATVIGKSSLIPQAFDDYKKKFSDVDCFTGLLKRRAILKHIDKLLQINAPFKLYLVDIKSMDLINIRYGREFGDELLVKTAEALSELGDFGAVSISRFGGDSFMFIVPYSSANNNLGKIDAYLAKLNDILKFKFKNEELFPDNLEFTIVKTDYSEGISANELVFIARRYKKASSV